MSDVKTATDIIVALLDDSANQTIDFGRIREAYKRAQNRKIAKAAAFFSPGDRVVFNNKRGSRVYGKVTKVNAKTLKVFSDDNVNWTVSPGLVSYAPSGK